MFIIAIFKALQVYDIAIVISMLADVLIKIMVVATNRVKTVAQNIAIPPRAIAESNRMWAHQGCPAQHSHQPRH
jgi:hypothetical protein